MIFVSDGVLINGEEIIKRDSRGGERGKGSCGSRRATIKIENWVDPEAPMKSYARRERVSSYVFPLSLAEPYFGWN